MMAMAGMLFTGITRALRSNKKTAVVIPLYTGDDRKQIFVGGIGMEAEELKKFPLFLKYVMDNADKLGLDPVVKAKLGLV